MSQRSSHDRPFRPFTVTFHLDGTGVYYDPAEPIMLDALLAAAVARWHVHGEPPARDEAPADIPLPLRRWQRGDTWGWCASALFPDGPTAETLVHWRKRLRQSRMHVTEGSPNVTNGTYRDWQMPVPLLLTHRLVAYGVGPIYDVRRELRRNIRWLGKKRAHGHGHVVSIDVEPCDADYSLVKDGTAMRWLPDADGPMLVRPRPPYWNIVGRVPCCAIGAEMRA